MIEDINSVDNTSISKLETNNDLKKYIISKKDILIKRGIIILEPMTKTERKKLYEVIDNIPDIVQFSIGDGTKKRIVLRYKPQTSERLDLKKITLLGIEAYKNGNYEECISQYRKLLEIGNPPAHIYSRLGLSYLKIGKKITAIDYLEIATDLSRKGDKKFDFSDLILHLKNQISSLDKKTYVKMLTDDFNDTNNNYGIDNIDNIKLLLNSGCRFDDVCLKFNLTEEQKSILLLILARDSYSACFYELGDKYMKIVEKMKNKTSAVKELFLEIRKNRLFYKNRDIDTKKLILVPNIKR